MNVFKLFGEISIDKSGAIKGIKQVEGQASKSSLAMQKTFNKLAKVAKVAMIAGAVAATAAIVKMTKDSIKAFAEFEEGMNEVFTLLPDITEEAMDSMKEDVKSLAKEMGILPDEIVPALYQAISAGIPAENVFDFMRVASTAAIGGVTDLETAVDGLTSIINAYGRENMTARDAADILFTAVRLGKTTMEELSDRLFQVNPIAAALGVRFEDVAAAMAEITAAGVPTRVAATQLRQMFMELSRAGSDVALTFEAVAGESFQDFIASGHNVGDALQLLTDYADENDIKMQDMFGSVEAGQAVLALTGTHLDSYTAKIAEMDNAAGAADAAHEKMEGGLKRTWAKIMAWWAVVKIDLGEKLQAPLERLMDWLNENREKIEDGIKAIFDKLIDAAMWIMDHSGMIARALKAVAIGFGLIVAIKMGGWVAGAVTKLGILAATLGPAGALVLGLAAVALGFKKMFDAAVENAEEARERVEHLDKTVDELGGTIDIEAQRWNARAGSMAESSAELARVFDQAVGVMGEKMYELVRRGKIPLDMFIAMLDELGEAALQASRAPVSIAVATWETLKDEVLAKYEEMYSDVGVYREEYLEEIEADTEEEAQIRNDAIDRMADIEATRWNALATQYEQTRRAMVDDTIESGQDIINETDIAQTAISALARFGTNVRIALSGEEKTAITLLRQEFQELATDLGETEVGTIEYSNAVNALSTYYDSLVAEQERYVAAMGYESEAINNLIADIEGLDIGLGDHRTAWERVADQVAESAAAMVVGTDGWVNYVAGRIQDFSRNFIDRFTNMFTTNLQAEADYNAAVRVLNDNFISDKHQLTTDYEAELTRLARAYDNNELTHEQYLTAMGIAESDYLADLLELETRKETMLAQEAQSYEDQRVTIGDVLSGMLQDFFGYLQEYFSMKAAAALAEALIMTLTLNPLAFLKYAEAAGYAALAAASAWAGWAAATPTAPTPEPEPTPDEPTPAEDTLRNEIVALASRASGMSSVTSLGPEIDALWYNARSVLGTGHAALTKIGEAYVQATRYDSPSATAARLGEAATLFAEGGLIGKMSEPILAMLGEGRHEEAVLPLSKPVFRELGQGIIEALTGVIAPQPAMAMAGGGDVYVTIESAVIREEADIDKVATRIVELTGEERRAQGRDSLIGG